MKELLDVCDKKGNGYQSLHVIARWLDRTDPDVFESLKYRLVRLRSLDEKQFEHEFRLRDDFHLECEIDYEVNADSEIQITTRITPMGEAPVLPRIGYLLALPAEYDEFWWYGRGPLETYPDRQQGRRMGVFHGRVAEQFIPYGRPQETGNKTDVRWYAVLAREVGLRIESDALLSLTARNFLDADLDDGDSKQQRHTAELLPLPCSLC